MSDYPDNPNSVTSVRTPDNVLLATMLRDARTRAGISQISAAFALNLPQSYISKVEMLEYRVLPAVARRLCEIYGVDPRVFFAEWAAAVPSFVPEEEGRVVRADKGTSRL